MSRRRRRPLPDTPRTVPLDDQGDGLSLLELDRFSEASIVRWRQAHEHLGHLQAALHFGLETGRQSRSDDLIAAARAAGQGPFEFQGWCRIVDYRYSLTPLSCAGSLSGEGGRFNIGRDLDAASFTPFPAIYIGDSYTTAYHEKFQQPPPPTAHGLTVADLALRSRNSFTQCRLHGRLEQVIDVADLESLKPIVAVLRGFALPGQVAQLARRLGLRMPALVRTPQGLQRQLMSKRWRILPMQFDLPSNSQVFGRLVAGAGIHGLRYPSARAADGECIALFPQNWRDSGSFVEVSDPAPPGASMLRLDGATGALM